MNRSAATPVSGHGIRTAMLLWLLAAGGLWTGCGDHGGPITTRLQPGVQRPDPGVVILFGDALRADVIEQGCRDGTLPSIRRYFHEGGMRCEHAITCIPSITYPVMTTMLTGATPDRHGIVGIWWFDRDAPRLRNYATIRHYRTLNHEFAPEWSTLYERLAPEPSVSVQHPITRGLQWNFDNWAPSGVMWFFGDFTAVDKLTASTLEHVAARANWDRQWPTVLMLYFPGPDALGTDRGASSPEYAWSIRHFDHQVGRVCDWLEREGLLDTTYVVLISDHGLVDTPQHIDLLGLVRDGWGRAATNQVVQDGSEQHRRAFWDQYDTVVIDQGTRFGMLYFRGDSGWAEIPAPMEVERIITDRPADQQLWNLPGIDVVAYLSPDGDVILRSPRGRARIESRQTDAGREFRYVPIPDDVLGYTADPSVAAFVSAGFHDERAWIDRTADQSYPAVVPYLGPMLEHRRTGEVFVFPEAGFTLNGEPGGHGGLDPAEMRFTLYIRGPGLTPGGTWPVAHMVDIVPTLLNLLNQPTDDLGLQGVPRLPQAGERGRR